MKKWLMSFLLCLSVFFVFGCSSNNVGDEPEIEEEVYEEVDDIDDLDLDLEDMEEEGDVEEIEEIEEIEITGEEEPEQDK